MTEHEDWTRYHIIKTFKSNKWKFYKPGAKRSIKTGTRQEVIKEALYYVCDNGGYLVVHKPDASVDFIVDNWCG
jgi:hypothetical protein